MTSSSQKFDTWSVEEVASACAQQASRASQQSDASSPCYELFRRACELPRDEAAWQALLNQYHRLVRHWLDQHASDDHVQEVFLRFWKAQEKAKRPFAVRFRGISAVMGYLKRCAVAVRIDAWREEKRRRAMREQLRDERRSTIAHTNPAPHPLQSLVQSKLKSKEEYVVFELTYYYDLPPRDIQAVKSDLFPDVQRIYRVKENLLKRLRRDPEIRDWLCRL
jgi:DNA-directed RNA polymerase specialized sigma24 family protein